MIRQLKKYDKYLTFKRKLNGIKQINRVSPFSSQTTFHVLDIENQYTGSWVLKKIASMDHQKVDLITKSILNNKRIRDSNMKNSMHNEIADFFMSAGEKLVL